MLCVGRSVVAVVCVLSVFSPSELTPEKWIKKGTDEKGQPRHESSRDNFHLDIPPLAKAEKERVEGKGGR